MAEIEGGWTVFVLLCLFWLMTSKLGDPALMLNTRMIPTTPRAEALTLCLMVFPYIIPRVMVMSKTMMIVQNLTLEEAVSVQPRLRRVLYRHFWRGSVEQKQAVATLASLSKDESALPFLRKMAASKNLTLELKALINDAIACVDGN